MKQEYRLENVKFIHTKGQYGYEEIIERWHSYNLDAVISVGYRINSLRATQFRQWATKVLRTFTLQGYVLDKKRLENEIAKAFAESEFEKHRVIQDQLYESDFDKLVMNIDLK